MKKIFQYVLKVNSENFKWYLSIIAVIIILDQITGVFTPVGIKPDALLAFLGVSFFLKTYPYIKHSIKTAIKVPSKIWVIAVIALPVSVWAAWGQKSSVELSAILQGSALLILFCFLAILTALKEEADD